MISWSQSRTNGSKFAASLFEVFKHGLIHFCKVQPQVIEMFARADYL